jgi:hypothetical protein
MRDSRTLRYVRPVDSGPADLPTLECANTMAVGAPNLALLRFLQCGGDASAQRNLFGFDAENVVKVERRRMPFIATVTASMRQFELIERRPKRGVALRVVCSDLFGMRCAVLQAGFLIRLGVAVCLRSRSLSFFFDVPSIPQARGFLHAIPVLFSIRLRVRRFFFAHMGQRTVCLAGLGGSAHTDHYSTRSIRDTMKFRDRCQAKQDGAPPRPESRGSRRREDSMRTDLGAADNRGTEADRRALEIACGLREEP